MPLKATEVGKSVRVDAKFDLTSFTILEVGLTDPSGAKTTISSPRVTIGTTDAIGTNGPLTAGHYVKFLTQADDFPIAGAWSACVRYFDNSPKAYYGGEDSFEVGAAC